MGYALSGGILRCRSEIILALPRERVMPGSDDLAARLASWDPKAKTLHRKAVTKPSPQGEFQFGSDGLPLPAQPRTRRHERDQYTGYLVGGRYEWSGYIPAIDVRLCEHDHGEVDAFLASALIKRGSILGLFKRHCLLEAWRHHLVGTICVKYGNSEPFGLWVIHNKEGGECLL